MGKTVDKGLAKRGDLALSGGADAPSPRATAPQPKPKRNSREAMVSPEVRAALAELDLRPDSEQDQFNEENFGHLTQIANETRGDESPLGQDAVVQSLVKDGLPVTRENYLRLSGWAEPLDAELEGTLPPELQRWNQGAQETPEDEDPRVGALRLARFRDQNRQLLGRRKTPGSSK